MKIFINVKSIGQRRPKIRNEVFEITEEIKNSNQLIKYIVKKNVEEFNNKKTEQDIFKYLTQDELENKTYIGKVGFEDKKNSNLQNKEEAVLNAIESYFDGIYKLFINDEEIDYNSEINLKEEDTLTFIRLTMLSGRMW